MATESTSPTDALIGFVRKHAMRLRSNADEAMRKGSVDAVHDYRVASRRLREPLVVMQPWLRDADVRGVLRDLRRMRRACRNVRDLDVLQESLAGGRAATELSADDLAHLEGLVTSRRQRRMRRASRRLARINIRSLIKRIEMLTSRFAEKADAAQVCERACGLWLARALKLRACAPTMESGQLHRTRLCLKSLRYCSELLDMTFNRPKSQLVLDCAEMQDLLGTWNDDLMAAGYLARFALAEDQLADQEAWSADVLAYAARRIRLAEAGRSVILSGWPDLARGIESYGDGLCSDRNSADAPPTTTPQAPR